MSASITYSSTAAALMTASRYSGSWYGLYTPGEDGLWFTIQVNARSIDEATSTSSDFEKWAKSTSTYELGHSLRLDDNPNTSSASLMKHSRNRLTLGSPTAYDKANVKACY